MKYTGPINLRSGRSAWALSLTLVLTACGGGKGSGAEDSSSVAAQSTRQRAQAAAQNPASWVAVQAPADALFRGLNIPANAPAVGMWSPAAAWPMVGVNQAVLPNGKVLTWGTTPDGGGQNGRFFDVWDPDRGLTDPANHQLTFDAARQDSFCAPASFFADGRLMITGGNGDGSGKTSQLYTPSNGAFARGANVADARWYGAMVTLPDGRPILLGGINPYTEGQYNDVAGALARGESSMTPEVFENGAWRSLFGAQSRTAFGPDFLRASLPKVWVAPDGRVFGIGTDQMYYVDPNAGGGNGAISIVGGYKTPPQAGALNDSAPNVGPTMSGVMYAAGKVMTAGGNSYHNGSGFWASRKATSIDLNGGGAALTELPNMAYPRNFANLIALPDGKVLATGGETRAINDPGLGVFPAESWNPVTNSWTTLAAASVFRGYHSQTSLLPNGTVLSTGGGNPGPVQLKGEVFYPPYLFRTINGAAQLAPRPQLIGISGLKHAHGAQLQFDLSNNSAITQVALIGLSVGTHSFNSGQRRIPLTYSQDAFRITATVPNANLTPPGYYQLVAIDANGVPSRGTIIAVGNNVTAPPVATTAYTPPDTAGGGVTPPPPPTPAKPSPSGTTLLAGSAGSLVDRSGAVWTYGQNVRNGTDRDLLRNGAATSGFANKMQIADDGSLWAQAAGGSWWTYNGTTWVQQPGGPVVTPPAPPATGGTGTGLSATYFASRDLTGPAVLTRTEAPQFDWGAGAPAAGVPADNFSVRWSGSVQAVEAGNYQFRTLSDDGVRVWINGAQVINNWTEHPPTENTSAAINLAAGQRVSIVVEYYDAQFGATLRLNWVRPNGAAEAIPAAQLYATAVTPPPGPTTIPAFSAPLISAGAAATYTVAAQAGTTYSWSFGDGSAPTAFSATATTTRVFANPGIYGVTLTAQTAGGLTSTRTVLQAVRSTAAVGKPTASGATAFETRANASGRLWVVNPDNDSVSVIDTASNARVAEIAVGKGPRSVAIAGDGRVWVSNKDAASLSIINPATLAVVQTVALPAASQPHGLAFATGGSAYVVLEATGQLQKLDPVSGATQATLAVGPNVRHVSLSGDGATALVSRFITPSLPGEGTAAVNTTTAGGEVLVVNAGPMTLNKTVLLRHSDKVDNEVQGAGIPNYLGAAAFAPDGKSAWVPSKQDNIKRGTLRNTQGLNFQNTVRAISSRIDIPTLAEDYARRVDHDNSSLGSSAAYHPTGAYLFVTLETSRQLAILDPLAGRELLKVDVGRAPQSVTVSADGLKLYVQNFMDRSVTVLDLAPLVNQGQLSAPVLATVGTVATEKLAAPVLQGKQLFYDARDPRLTRDNYMSCASCHSEAGHDGRTWDFTGFGEGLRNTPALKGRAGMGQGFVHWSANFDEIQDFEGQIRAFAGGTGLMTDAQFNTGTRNTPLGDKKAGVSADLDALAAYLGSLNSFDASPLRNADGTLTAAAAAGKAVFTAANCASCHAGNAFTLSANAGTLKNIGTIKPSSGQRLSAGLTGLDVPTLRDVWKTGPYLHDGSAATLAAAVQAHAGNTVSGVNLDNLVAYLQQIGSQEPAAPGAPAPTPGTGTGLTGTYFASNNLSGAAVLTRTEVPSFDWGLGSPAPAVPADNFSVRWTGEVQALEAGTYQFRTNSDDGVRVSVNGALVINNWTVHAPTVDTSGVVTLAAGQRVPVVIEFQEFNGGAVLQLSWLRPGGVWAPIPAAQLYATAAPVANKAPTVALTAPAANASVTQGTAITITATATDSDGTVAKVDFYDGATLLSTDTTAPYSYTWTNAATGVHNVTARATDNLGAVTTTPVTVLTVTGTPVVVPPSSSPLFGTPGAGTAFTDPIATGQVLTGVVVRAGWWIDSIQGLATPANLPAHGGTGGGVYTATWPATEYLVRVFGQVGSNGFVAQISFATNTGRVLGPYGSALGVGTLSPFDYTVPAGRRVAGFTGSSGGYLNAIGVIHGP